MAKKAKQSTLKKHYSFPLWQIVIFVALFAGVGVYTLTQSNANPKRGGGSGTATLKVELIASTKSPGYALMHITGCGYAANAYVTQFNYKYLDAAYGWASFGSLPVGANGCIDFTDTDNGVVLRKFVPGNYTANISQNFLRKGSGTSHQTIGSATFVVGSNGLTQ